MRVAGLSLFLYSLSLVAIVAGQSAQVTDIVTDITDPTNSTPTAGPTDTETDSSTTTSTSSTTDDEPSSTPTPTTTTTEEPTSTSTTSTEPTTTTTSSVEPTTTTSSSSEDTPTATVTTITSTQIISGTPVPTTFTSSADSSQNTDSPGLSGDGGSGSSGLDDGQKKIIIGVVVGVGGAILIGAIAVVAWRIHARKRNAHENDDVTDLMSGTAVGAGAREKAPSPGAGGTPFKSTLDQYHNPGPVNAASNF